MRLRSLVFAVVLPGGFIVLLLVVLFVGAHKVTTILKDLVRRATGARAVGEEELARSIVTGDALVDRFAAHVARATIAEHGAAHPELGELARVALQLVAQETRGRSAPQVGDRAASGGPSVGPMQVYRVTAEELGLFKASSSDPHAEYEQRAWDEAWGIVAGVHVLAVKLRIAKKKATTAIPAGAEFGPAVIRDGIRRYNGAGDMAARYQGEVLARGRGDYGSEWLA